MPPSSRAPRRHWSGWWAPLVLSAGLVALDVASGPGIQYAGAFCAVPLLASALAGPVLTSVQGAGAAVACLVLGAVETARADQVLGRFDVQLAHQLVRVLLIMAMTVLAVAVSAHRVRAERRARQVEAVADAAQQAILSTLPARVGGLDCASTYVSAASQARIGGDLVEVVETPFGVRALIGDVQGKGLDAVRLAGRVLGCFREVAHSCPDLPGVVVAMDRAVARSAAPDVFVTAAVVELDAGTGRLDVVSCGHPAPFVVDPAGAADGVRPSGSQPAPARELDLAPAPPLGMLELSGAPEVTRARLEPGQRMVLVTDGLLEARRPRALSRRPTGPFVDAETLLGRSLAPGSTLAGGLDAVVRGARRWSRGRLRDDMALLVLARPAPVPPAPVTLSRGSAPGGVGGVGGTVERSAS